MNPRDAEERDIDHLARVWFDSWRDAHEQIVPPELTRLRTLESFRDRLQAALPNVTVVGPLGSPVGFYMLKAALRSALGTAVKSGMPQHVPQRENLNATPKQLSDVFLLRKGEMVATCQLWTHGFGWECRLFAGEELIATQVCQSDTEIQTFETKWREALTIKGWS